MGKRIIAQRRGKGSPTYKSNSFHNVGKVSLPFSSEKSQFEVLDLVKCPGHSAPLMYVRDELGFGLSIAPEGVKVGDVITQNDPELIQIGSVLKLQDIPEGTEIYNIESTPGDGGKFVRSSGTFAKLVSKMDKNVSVILPSKKVKLFNSDCRAVVGVVAGSGRVEKPFLKAGRKFFKMKSKNKLWPKVSGGSMNAVDHPFGNKRSSRKSKAKPAPKNAPPGRLVGAIRARRTGRRKK